MTADLPPTLFARAIGMAALCAAFLALAQSAPAIDYVSAADGPWGTTTTWDPNGVPVAGDNVLINHVVTLDSDRAADDVVIGSGGDLQMGAATLSVFQDFTLASGGVLTKGTSRLRFTGSGPQLISGALDLYTLIIANTAASPDDTSAVVAINPIHASGGLYVQDGQFMPPDGSSFRFIEISGILKPAEGAETIVTGSLLGDAFENSGSFVHNGGKLTFAGSGAQRISAGSSTLFNDVEVANTALIPSPSSDVEFMFPTGELEGTLSVLDGLCTVRGNVHDVFIGEFGTIHGNSSTSVSGDWTIDPGGTFIQEFGEVTFNGTGPQVISGETTFGSLVIANSATLPDNSNVVVSLDPVHSIRELHVIQGQFIPADGSSFNDIFVGADGILKPEPAATISLTGSFLNYAMLVEGAFVHNGGTIRFAGNDTQWTDTAGATFYNVIVANTADTVINESGVSVEVPIEANLLILDGRLTTYTGARVHDVTIAADGVLNQRALDLAISGDFTLDGGGTFDSNYVPVTFSGSTQQTISGSPAFDTLNIAKKGGRGVRGGAGSVIALHSVSARTALNVLEGRFILGGSSTFRDTYIGLEGSFEPSDAVVLTFTGDLINSGTLACSTNEVRFEGTGIQMLQSDNAVAFASLHNASILYELGDADNFTNNGNTTNNGIMRRIRSVTGPGVVTGGLTGASLNFADVGSVTSVVIDRYGSVPNATPDHLEPVSWRFNVDAGVAYEASVTLSHALEIPSRAIVSRYLGTGTDWDYLRNSFTTTTVTRTGVMDLSSRWAVADRANASVENGLVLY